MGHSPLREGTPGEGHGAARVPMCSLLLEQSMRTRQQEEGDQKNELADGTLLPIHPGAGTARIGSSGACVRGWSPGR